MTDKRKPARWASFVPILVTGLSLAAYGQQSDAEKLIEAGHWKKARAIVDARFRQNPNDPSANFLLSQIRNAFGDYTSPIGLAEKAVALDGRVAKYHRQLAEVLGVEAQHAGSIRIMFLAHQFRSEIDTAISLDPRDLQAQRDLLEYYLIAPGIAGGDIRKAAAAADNIAALDAAEGFLAKARVASFRKQTAETEALLRQAAQVQPPSYRAHLELAKFYLAPEHANSTAAEGVARELLTLDRSRVDPYAFLATIYAQRGDWTALDAILAEGAKQCPDDLVPFYRAADALLDNGRDPARPERYFRAYLEGEPEGNEPSAADARRKLTAASQTHSRAPMENHPTAARMEGQ